MAPIGAIFLSRDEGRGWGLALGYCIVYRETFPNQPFWEVFLSRDLRTTPCDTNQKHLQVKGIKLMVKAVNTRLTCFRMRSSTLTTLALEFRSEVNSSLLIKYEASLR